MENIITNLIALAVQKRETWHNLERAGHSDIANDYWCEYHGVLSSLEVVTGKSYAEVLDMVLDAA